MRYMNKAAKLCIVLAAIICLFSITAYESNTPTKEETLNSSDEYLPPTTNISDSYLNSSADKKENNHHTPSPISDHLGLLCVNDGKQKLQVVCGAPNCHQGMVGIRMAFISFNFCCNKTV